MNTVGAANTSSVITATADTMHLEIFAKLGNRETHYQADSAPGVIGDISTGSLFICTLGNIGAGNENYGLDLSIRVRYSDL